MEYLKRRSPEGVLLRSDVRAAFPWARSVIVCAFDYSSPGRPLSIDPAPAGAGWVARYAWSGREQDDDATGQAALIPSDYHDQLLTRLQRVESALRSRLDCQTRCYVDTGPILERGAAAQAGIGWVGKNTCILNQQVGSWLLLGVIVTSVAVGSSFAVLEAADRCGSCTRCIDACPTAALVAPREMDASRCISYLTIEKKGSIAEDLRPLMGRQVFGCDICQDVCPWNRKSATSALFAEQSSVFSARRDLLPRRVLINPELDWLAALDQQTFKRYFKGSPLERTRRRRLLRNVALAMGNSGLQRFIPTLQGWASGAEEDPILADAALWALCRLGAAPQKEIPPASVC